MVNKKSPTYKFKKAWSWPFEIEKFVEERLEGFTVHVCCGESELGDVRFDLYTDCDLKADMLNPPIRDQIADTVLCDPPWTIPYHLRHKLLYKLRDMLKAGGKLIFNCYWWPKVKGLEVQEWWIGVPNSTWRNVSLLIIARKIMGQFPRKEAEM